MTIDAPKSPAPKTVKVRVAVAITKDGRWSAYGNGFDNPDEMEEEAQDFFEGRPCQIRWLTAEFPIPEPLEIAATVEPAPCTEIDLTAFDKCGPLAERIDFVRAITGWPVRLFKTTSAITSSRSAITQMTRPTGGYTQ